MIRKHWRGPLVAVLSIAILNTGAINAAHAGIVDTSALVQTTRDASIATIQTQLARQDVGAQLARFGVEPAAIEARLATLSDGELAALAKRMQETPAGGDGLLAILGITFVVLLVLELVGVIDIFKTVGPRR
jgi:hypothetical protein